MTREEKIRKAADDYCGCDTREQSPCFYAHIRNAFLEGAEWADQHPHWIPVEERLPKFDEQVLVYGLCPNGCRVFYVDCLIQDINDNGYPKWDDDTIIPTHWMPIVPPRKED